MNKLTSLGRLARAFAALVLATASFAAFAQAVDNASPLTSQLVQQKVMVTAGKETFGPAAQIKPGDIIQYTATYHNVGQRTLKNLGLTLPVPPGMVCLTNSALNGSVLEASLDGQNFSPVPLKRVLTTADGRKVETEASVSEFRALRWALGTLDPGASVNVSIRALVSTGAPVRQANQ
jgi:uncharacterized repeat protein (TIGR01451 family)